MEINQLNNITFSRPNHDSTTQPFFLPIIDNEVSESISIIEDNNLLLNIEFKELNLEKAITDFYLDNNAYNREMYINSWTFFSIQKILELNKYYIENTINNVVDLGFIYHGLGHIKVAFYSINTKKIHFRMDGGSNDYDRIENFNDFKELSKKLENLITNDGIDFNIFIYNISNNISNYLL